MKTTYLLREQQADGSIRLVVASAEAWRSAVAANKNLPTEQRRYFVFDYIPDGDEVDRMVIETSIEDYRVWHKDHMSAKRNREYGKGFQILSMDALIATKDGPISFGDLVLSGQRVEDDICNQMLMDKLRTELAEWRPWANDVLDLYLQGKKRICTDFLAEKYGVSLQAVRKYKRQFEAFLKKFLSDVSF